MQETQEPLGCEAELARTQTEIGKCPAGHFSQEMFKGNCQEQNFQVNVRGRLLAGMGRENSEFPWEGIFPG